MTSINTLSGAIRLALLAGGISMIAAPGYAQGTDDDDDVEQLVTVQVTGSRIQSQSITASSPVTVIDREEFSLAGATRVDDLLNQYPQLQPQFDSSTNNGAIGYATVDLRGLGASRTLVLVNGQRLPPGPTASLRDISIIPAALISRVDILTGGASAVYGSDAVAGVINFVLDTEFEGISVNAGYSAYQHNNDNELVQGLSRARGFEPPEGSSGLDGESKNIDIAIGGQFADGAGHAMAWLTWRDNEPLFQGERDYSFCALNGAGNRCGGSATNVAGNFYFYGPSIATGASLDPTTGGATWRTGYGDPYNFAPINYYQRPDKRYTAGGRVSFEVNEHFKPFVETMFINRRDAVQIAETGTFFIALPGLSCDANPFLGSACTDLNIPTDEQLVVYVAKRNVEGGPRRTATEDSTYRFIFGAEGAISDNWSYSATGVFAHTDNDNVGSNDFLNSRTASGLLGCPAGSFAGCLPYDVWSGIGLVDPLAAAALAGTSLNKTSTEMTVLNAYASGDLGFAFPSADGSNVSLVIGVESRKEEFSFVADSNSAAGNFAGAGAAAAPINGDTSVQEIFFESAVPIYVGDGLLKSFDLDLGYRYSDYDRSGGASTYKIGFIADMGMVRLRGGFNHAIRAPSINNLFNAQRTALFVGADPCAGAAPTLTQAQCANTGVSAAQYGNVPANPAGQQNQFIGGDPNLQPEEADTFTFGVVLSPIQDLTVTMDYYDIEIEDTISTITAPTILQFCGITGDPFLCQNINRNPISGDIWRSTNQFVTNLTSNFGGLSTRGIDLGVNYGFDALGGRINLALNGSYLIEFETDPLPGVNSQAIFDCAGVINPACLSTQPDWRHVVTARYSRGDYTANLRWRYFGEQEYRDEISGLLTADPITAANGGIDAFNYLDISGSVAIGSFTTVTVGVNNVFDREPPLVSGAGLGANGNGNAPGAYDQAGRFIFSNVSFTF